MQINSILPVLLQLITTGSQKEGPNAGPRPPSSSQPSLQTPVQASLQTSQPPSLPSSLPPPAPKSQAHSQASTANQANQTNQASQANQALGLNKGLATAKSTLSTGTSHSLSAQPTAGKEGSGTQNDLTFVPLPLKSDIFPDARFYKQIDPDEKQKNPDTQQNRLIFGLKTSTLGELYFLIIQQENKLSINCTASRPQSIAALKNGLSQLKKELHQSGWTNITCSCMHVEKPDQSPSIPPAATPLGVVDLKI